MATNLSPQLRFLTDASYLLRQSAPETSAYLMAQYIDSTTHNFQHSKIGYAWTDTRRQQICTSCGSIMVPGCSDTSIRIQTGIRRQLGKSMKWRIFQPGSNEETSCSYSRTRSSRLNRQHAGLRKIYTCGCCRKETRITLPPPLPLPKHRKRMALTSHEDKHEPAPGPLIGADTLAALAVPTALQKLNISRKSSTAASVSSTARGANSVSNASSRKRAKNRKAGILALLDKNRENASGGDLENLSLSFDNFRKK